MYIFYDVFMRIREKSEPSVMIGWLQWQQKQLNKSYSVSKVKQKQKKAKNKIQSRCFFFYNWSGNETCTYIFRITNREKQRYKKETKNLIWEMKNIALLWISVLNSNLSFAWANSCLCMTNAAVIASGYHNLMLYNKQFKLHFMAKFACFIVREIHFVAARLWRKTIVRSFVINTVSKFSILLSHYCHSFIRFAFSFFLNALW